MEYSCPHLKGPDVTENRVVGNKKNQKKMFSSADLMCKHLNAAERFNVSYQRTNVASEDSVGKFVNLPLRVCAVFDC